MPDVTLKDVAERAGVHFGTVSRALDPKRSHVVSPETRERVEAAARELGYQANAMARGLRKGSTGLIGVVVADLGNPFLPPILRGLEDVLGARDFMTAVSETHEDALALRRICEHLVSRRVDGIVISAAHIDDGAFITQLEQSIPVVLMVRRVSGGGHHTVTHDDVLGARMVTEHLLSVGHRRIAQLRGPAGVSSFAGRSRGFAEVMDEHACPEVEVDDCAAEPTTAEGKRMTSALLTGANSLPTAIFAHNDPIAIGALEAIHEAGLRCPDDISVVGYNDAPLTAHLTPPLTTVRLPSRDLGRRAGTMLLNRLDGRPEPPGTIQLEPQLIVRASVSAPAAARSRRRSG